MLTTRKALFEPAQQKSLPNERSHATLNGKDAIEQDHLSKSGAQRSHPPPLRIRTDSLDAGTDDESYTCQSAGCVWPCPYHWHIDKTPDFAWKRDDPDLFEDIKQSKTHAANCICCQLFISIADSWCTCYRNYNRKPNDCGHEFFQAMFRGERLARLKGYWTCAGGEEVLEVGIEGPDTLTIPLRPVSGTLHEDRLSEDCISLYRSWVEECDSMHTRCAPVSAEVRPGKVIQCLPGGQQKLCQTHPGWQERYLALSYCWGDVQPPSTTTENLESHQVNIPWDLLPPLYQDVITLARKLGVQYVWIDALCIVQDDAKDKDREIYRMDEIFKASFFVIIAASTTSPRSSFIRNDILRMTVRDHQWHEVQLPETSVGQGRVKFRQEVHATRGHDACRPAHVSSRAWTYQERLLARRCMIFRHSDVVWECRSGCRCECSGDMSLLSPSKAFQSQLLPYISQDSSQDDSRVHFGNADDAYAFWRQAVGTFSSRRMSHDTDKLPAISALARTIGLATSDEYLAGIWRNDLPVQLMWHCDETFDEPRVPSEYLAPSWSWVSACADASYAKAKYYMDNISVEVIEAWCRTAGNNPFGQVVDGALVLRGVQCDAIVRVSECTDILQPRYKRAFVELYLDDGRFHFAESPHIEPTFLDGYQVAAVKMKLPTGEVLTAMQRVSTKKNAVRLPPRPCQGAARILWLQEEVVLILAYSRSQPGSFERLGILIGVGMAPPMPNIAPSDIRIV